MLARCMRQVLFMRRSNITASTVQVKLEVSKKTSQGASDERYQVVFVLKHSMWRGQSLDGDIGWARARSHPPFPMKRINVEV